MNKTIFLSLLFIASNSFADVYLTSGESTSIGGETVTCNSEHHRQRTQTHCYCANKGCSTGYTSKGNVILNVVTTDSNGRSDTVCAEYDTDLLCLQAMAACN